MNPHLKTQMRNFYAIGPHAGAHRVALRAAVCLAGPLLLLYFLGRIDLAIYASFGAFAAVYGRNDSYAARVSMQATAGTTIVVAMLLGTRTSWLDLPNALRVLVISLIATAVTLVAFRLAWKPTGDLFAVFSSGGCATIPATGITMMHVSVVGGGTVLFSLLVSIVLAIRRQPLTNPVRPPVIASFEPRFITNAIIIFAASLIAGLTGQLLFGDHWYWATIASIAVLVGPNIHARLTRGLQRFLGTVVGVVFAAGVMWIDPPIIIVLVIAIVCQGTIELIVLRNYAAAMILITIIALTMVNMASPLPQETLIRNRVLETLVGVIVGMAVTVVVQMMDVDRTRSQPA